MLLYSDLIKKWTKTLIDLAHLLSNLAKKHSLFNFDILPHLKEGDS